MDEQEKSLQIHEWERYGYFHLFSMKWEKKNLKYLQSGIDMVFHRIFPFYANLYIPRRSFFSVSSPRPDLADKDLISI